MLTLAVFLAVGCETTGDGCQQGYQQATSDMDPNSRRTMDGLTRGGRTLPSSSQLSRAIDPGADCDSCSSQRNNVLGLRSSGRGSSAGWDEFVQHSRRSGNNFSGPYGRVEFYNGSHLSLPGGAGITAVGKARHLDRKILDIMPILAEAHKAEGQPVRVSHTTSGRHSQNSLHYAGRAIDIDPDPASKKMAIARQIEARLKASGKGCGYFVYVEPSHIHVSFKGEGRTGCPGFSVK